MQELLSNSMGYSVSMEDELHYYLPENALGWLIARDDKQRNIGFIRSFKQSAEWTLAEFYIDPLFEDRKRVAIQLLKEFKVRANFLPGHRIRFDISFHDADLNLALVETGFSQKKQVFHYFSLSIYNESTAKELNSAIEPDRAQEISEVMSNLHPTTIMDVQKWVKEKTLRIVSDEDRICSVAQIISRGTSAEILRLATNPKCARKGYATQLLKEVCQDLHSRGKTILFLKVESIREPAILFYKQFGFHEIQDKKQIWHSSWQT